MPGAAYTECMCSLLPVIFMARIQTAAHCDIKNPVFSSIKNRFPNSVNTSNRESPFLPLQLYSACGFITFAAAQDQQFYGIAVMPACHSGAGEYDIKITPGFKEIG